MLNSSFTYTVTETVYYEYTVFKFSSYRSFYSEFFIAYSHRVDTQEEGKLEVGIIAGIAAAAVAVVAVVIGLIVRFGRHRKLDAEEAAGDYNCEDKELSSFTGTSELREIEEDPFAVDFKEQKFVTPL